MNKQQRKILVIGKEHIISCFRFLGFETLAITAENAKTRFEELKSRLDELGIIFITENFYENLKEEIIKLSSKTLPAIILIPDNTPSRNLGGQMMRRTVEQATGSDILSK